MSQEKNIFRYQQPDMVPIEQIRELSKVSGFRSLVHLLFSWGIIVGAVWLSEWMMHPSIYILAIILIGTRMLSLASMLHDGAHWMLFKNKKLNDWVVDLFMAWPIFHTLHMYRKDHLKHHKYLNTDDDPDWVNLTTYEEYHFPKSRISMLWMLMKDISGYHAFYYQLKKLFRKKKRSHQQFSAKPNEKVKFYNGWRFIYYVIVLGAITYYGLWLEVVLYWVVPAVTWFPFIMRIRTIMEHFKVPESAEYGTRTLKLNFLEKFLFVPYGLNYHVEHHLYPSVPFYRLPKLHKLMRNHEEYKAKAHLTKGVFGLIRECVTR